MKKNSIIFLSFIGLISLLFSCEKDETKVYMLDNPIPPKIITLPDLTLEYANEADTLIFIGTPVDLGFQTSASYFLEASATGNNFLPASNVVRVYFGGQDTLIKVTEKALNTLMKRFPAGVSTSVDFRIRAVATIDAGAGSLGSSANPLVVISEIITANVITYAPPPAK